MEKFVTSLLIKSWDEVSVRERSKSLESISSSLVNSIQSNDWLEWNSDSMRGTVSTTRKKSDF